MFVVNELFLLRTEGMALCEIASASNPSPEVQNACDELNAYYTATQEDFAHLCTGRSIALGAKDFDAIWKNVEGHLLHKDERFEVAFLQLSTDNILRAIALHELILQRHDWEDITYYALKSLPELYNRQTELGRLRRSQFVEKAPSALAVKTATVAL